jgi:excisionase family DNA binding protein
MNTESKILRVKELAEYLRCHPSTIYRLLRRHEIPAFRLGSDWRVNVEDVDAWLQKRSFGGDLGN